MRNFFKKIEHLFGWLDVVEFAIPAILAALLLIVGPVLACIYFTRTHHYVSAVVSVGLARIFHKEKS